MAVRVTSSVCKRFSSLSDEDAEAEGKNDVASLKQATQTMYPDIRDRNLVTVIRFESLFNSLTAVAAGEGT